MRCPYFEMKVSAGFPSPADGSVEKKLDLNELVIRNPAATFFVRALGDSMTGAHIQSGDLLVVDRSVEASSGKIVLAILDGEFTVKRLKKCDQKLFLHPENSCFSPMEISEDRDFQVWGVVTHVIHKCTHL